MAEGLSLPVFDYTLRMVALGSGALGVVSGALGVFAVLRKQGLLGDAISHAALPGIALAFLLTGSRSTMVLVLGAAAAGWIGTLAVMQIVERSRIKEDTALGLILSVFFGIGLVLLTYIQRVPTASQAGLDRFLFGQAAALVGRDVALIAGLGALALLVTALFWKEFKLLAFDRAFGESLGIPMRTVDVVLTSVLVLAIVIGLQTVGVVLMSAMVVAPAAAARQWTDRLGVMVLLSAAFGALAGVSGALVSSMVERLPTGPTIVLCISVIVLASLLFAPNRGLVWNAARRYRSRRRLRVQSVLVDLYALARQHEHLEHAHSTAAVRAMSYGRGGTLASLRALEQRGLVRRAGRDLWSLTPAGIREAESLLAVGDREAP
ncbi:MAG TPA: iron chelate uptake ABC transporter family permease subunit [Longimicrobiales bacterium]|nr:iron chelate uptake ABC transporter family permease subunit [Longimicrobiales bacterium]